jgi:hypothetical protein
MEAFQNTLNDRNLLDLGFSGPKFTWCNDRASCGVTREWLDRAIANHGWCQSYDVVAVDVLPRYYSDHHPILVFFSRHPDTVWKKRRQFRYESSWEKQKDYGELIKQVWRVRESSEAVWVKVRNNLMGCKRVLQRWIR